MFLGFCCLRGWAEGALLTSGDLVEARLIRMMLVPQAINAIAAPPKMNLFRLRDIPHSLWYWSGDEQKAENS